MAKTKLSEAIRRKRGVVSKAIPMRTAAKQAGVDANVVFRAEHGKPIRTEAFLRLCEWLNLDPRKVEMA